MKRLIKTAVLFLCATMSLVSFPTSASTYLRCYYQKTANLQNEPSLSTETLVEWGLHPNTSDLYLVNGRWFDISAPLENMFYSNTSQDKLLSICRETLKSKNIDGEVVMFSGGNYDKSADFTIWSLDSDGQLPRGAINKIISFGDSLSDSHNMFNHSEGILPTRYNYFSGRFSNGKNWLDYASASLNIPRYNWAVGGAGTKDVYVGVIPGFATQVESWRKYMDKDYAQNYRAENTLFTVLFGANDLISYSSPGDKTADNMIAEDTKTLNTLIEYGARNILLLTLPDISLAPLFTLGLKTKAQREHVKTQIDLYNKKLREVAATLNTSHNGGVNIQIFDVFVLMQDIMTNKEKYGITNTEHSCLSLDQDITSNYTEKRDPRPECKNNPLQADAFVFWDLLHPTRRVNQIFAEKVVPFIKTHYFLAP